MESDPVLMIVRHGQMPDCPFRRPSSDLSRFLNIPGASRTVGTGPRRLHQIRSGSAAKTYVLADLAAGPSSALARRNLDAGANHSLLYSRALALLSLAEAETSHLQFETALIFDTLKMSTYRKASTYGNFCSTALTPCHQLPAAFLQSRHIWTLCNSLRSALMTKARRLRDLGGTDRGRGWHYQRASQ